MAEAAIAKDPLIEKLNELQQLIAHVPGQSEELAVLKEKVEYWLGNGRPGEIEVIKKTTSEHNRKLWILQGAMIVILAEISVLAPILISYWLAHK